MSSSSNAKATPITYGEGSEYALLFRAMEDSAQAFAVRTFEGNMLFANKAFAELTGYPLEELMSSFKAPRLTPEHWIEYEKKIFDELLKTGTPQAYEKEYIKSDGSLLRVKVKIHIFTSHEGETCLFGFFDDISTATDIKRRLNSALIAGEVGTFEWDVVSNALWGDENFCRIFEIESSASGPKPLETFVEAIHPDDRERVLGLVANTVENSGDYEAEYRIINSNETRWIIARGKGEKDPISGRVVKFPGVILDVTRQKKVEEDLSRQRRYYEGILNNTPDLAYIFDTEHRFVYINDSLLKMWGRTFEEAVGKTCLELGYEKWHADLHSREIEQVKSTKKMIRGEVPFHGTFGQRIYDYIFVPIIGPDGEVEAIAGTTRDVTDRKEQDQRKDEFLATLAHELRNPLAPIRTGLEIIKRGNAEAATKARHMMERQLSHLVRLVDDLMDISRVSRGKVDLRFEEVELKKVIDLALETSRPLFSERNHVLDLAIADSSLIVKADVTRLSQVLSNLLNNAAKYTQEGGRISLSAYLEEGNIVFKVEDNGAGIPKEMLTKVFDLFTQVGKTIDRSQGGLGIGLSLVERLVELHGGVVWADSAGTGCGSTFTVKIPQEKAFENKDIANMSNLKVSKAASLKTKRILIVDDNLDGAESLAMMLGFDGHETATAHDGTQALKAIESFKPEVVFLDIGLPDMNGYEVAAEIKKEQKYAGMKLIALTGWGSSDDKKKAFECGFDYHITKPIEAADVESILSSL